MKGEVEDFVAKFEPVAHDCSKKDPVFFPSNGKPTIVSFLDTDSCFPTYGDILDQFIQKFTDQIANLLICYCNTKESDMATMSALSGLFEKLSGRVNVFPLEVSYNDEEALNLVKFQEAYNLSAKMIQVFTEIYDRLILNTGV